VTHNGENEAEHTEAFAVSDMSVTSFMMVSAIVMVTV
jgi:hypothetical protein